MHTLYPRPAWAARAGRLPFACLALLLLAALTAARQPRVAPQTPPAAGPSEPHAGPSLDRLPLSFVPNAGQLDPRVRFQAHGLGGSLLFTLDEVVLSLPPPPSQQGGARAPNTASAATIVSLRFEGQDSAARLVGGERLPGRASYFRGQEPARWRVNLPTYAGITYAALYPGVDLRYDGLGGQLKGTYVVAAGGDPGRIRWRYDGADSVRVDQASGDLRVELPGGAQALVERAPAAWQEIDGRRVAVPARYAIGADGSIGFALGEYDAAYPLTIDPTLEYSTFLGGSALDIGWGVAVDPAGNIYVVGSTVSDDFPLASPLQSTLGGTTCQFPEILGLCTDAFVAKYSPAKQLIYSTYLGGTEQDTGLAIVVDADGNAYITGQTLSPDFPASRALLPPVGATQEAFVTKISPTGSALVYSVLVGGNSADEPHGIAVDASGSAVITGQTLSTTFPTVHALQAVSSGTMEGFVSKLTPDGSGFVYSTYLGGSGADSAQSVAVDASGAAYVAGNTSSSDYPAKNAFQSAFAGDTDVFVSKLSGDGSRLIYSTYLGGSGGDVAHGIAVDAAGSAYLTGSTYSTGFPLAQPMRTQPEPGDNVFVTKLSPAGSALVYSTYVASGRAFAIAVDHDGYAYITGDTQSDSFPLVNPTQASLASAPDAFVAKLNRAGNALLFGTYLGGSSHEVGYGIDVDGAGHVYVTGATWSTDFPTTAPSQHTDGNYPDALLAEIRLPTTTIDNTLVDGLTGQPIRNSAGVLTIYRDVTPIETTAFKTDALGRFGVTFSGPISGGLRLGYSQIAGYPTQFEDRRPTVDEADTRLLREGTNAFTTRLLPATSLTNTLLDDLTGWPIAGLSGTLTVYSGTTSLETQPFTTDVNGSFRTTFTRLISQSVHLEYAGLTGYPRQYFDRVGALSQAAVVRLVSGENGFAARLVPSAKLVDTLLDDATGLPLASTSGHVMVYDGATVLDEQPFTTDAGGTFTATFTPLISQSVHLKYGGLSGYPAQYYDRALDSQASRPVPLRGGTNRLTSRLIPSTTLVNTLVDNLTGTPLRLTDGIVNVYSGTLRLESQRFTTDASGTFSATFTTLISQNVTLEYTGLAGYFAQYYDRQIAPARATPVALRYGRNALATRLIAFTTLKNTLLDDTTGKPIANTYGALDVYSGTLQIDSAWFTTDASGVYTATFGSPIDQDVALRYRIAAYATQFYDRKPLLGQATLVPLKSGPSTLTTRLLPRYTLVNTLLDDAAGQPITNTSGLLSAYIGTTVVESHWFSTDASGVYTTTFDVPLNQDVQLEYSRVAGHARQFYDRAFTLAQATPLALAPGRNTLSTRLLAAPTLLNTLLDDTNGLPLKDAGGYVAVYSGTLLLESQRFTASASGVFSVTLLNTPIGARVALSYAGVPGYARQFYDRKPALNLADSVVIGGGQTALTARLARATTLVNTLIDDATGLLVGNAVGTLEVYSGTTYLETASVTADATGVFTASLMAMINQDVRLAYQATGYPVQYFDRKPSLGQADPVALHTGNNALTTRLQATKLIDTLISDATGLPVGNAAGTLEVYSGTLLLDQLPFKTDASGVFTVAFRTLMDQDVRLAYRLPGYPRQFYDRATALDRATPVRLTVGRTTLTTHLVSTTLASTLLDDLTGAPLVGAAGTLEIYAGGALLEQQPFRTDASGVYTVTLARLVDQDVQIAHTLAGYPKQYYDRKLAPAQADPVRLRTGMTRLSARLLRETVLSDTLLDDLTGQPVRSAWGEVTFYSGASQLMRAQLQTDENGSFTLPFAQIVDQSVRIEYRFAGYLDQFADRQATFETADLIPLRPGPNSLTTRLVKPPSLTVTLIDDPTGRPIPGISGWLTAQWDRGMNMKWVPFTTDANGVFTAEFSSSEWYDSTVPFGVPLYLQYGGVPGYSDQFYDRVFDPGAATPVVLQRGANQLTTRILRPSTILGLTLKDGPYRIENRRAHVAIEQASGRVFEWDGTTDGNGGIGLELGWLTGGDFRIRIHVDGFPDQYIGDTTRFDQATLVPLYPGLNYRTVEVVRYPILFYTLLDADGTPLGNTNGEVRVYTDTNTFMTFRFESEESGVQMLELEGLDVLGDNVRLAYEVPGYPHQFYDRAATYAQATPVLLRAGTTDLTVRVAHDIVPPPGVVTPEAGGWLTETVGLSSIALAFPPGAVTEPLSATLTRQSIDPATTALRPVGPAFAVEAQTLLGAPVSVFTRPFTLTAHYDDALVAGVDERSLRIAYWDAAAHRWVDLPTQVDQAGNQVTTTSDRARRFAVLGLPRGLVYLPIVRR